MGEFRDMAFGADAAAAQLAQVRRLQSQTVASTFQPRKTDDSGASVYLNKTTSSLQAGSRGIASGQMGAAIGPYSYVKEDDGVAVGAHAQALGARNTIVGAKSTGFEANTTLVGQGSSASGIDSTVVGQDIISIGNRQTLVGQGIRAVGDGVTIVGQSATGTGDEGTVVGGGADSGSGDRNVAVGEDTNAGTGDDNTVIGAKSVITSSGSRNTIAGANNTISGTAEDSSILGEFNAVSASRVSVLGKGNTVTHADVVMFGNGGTSLFSKLMQLGTSLSPINTLLLGKGYYDAIPTALVSLRTTTSSGTDVSGSDLYVFPGLSTGTARPSRVVFSFSSGAETSGSTQHNYFDRYWMNVWKGSLTAGAANALTSFTASANKAGGCSIHYTLTATDGTDYQSASGIINATLVMKGAVVTTAIAVVNEQTAASVGTIGTTWTVATSQIKVNPAITGMVATDIQINYLVFSHGNVILSPV